MNSKNFITFFYPFGMLMPERSYSSGSYSFGFNGKEKVDEINGEGNSINFGERILDGRLGSWLSRDVLESKFPDLSPYNFCSNNPIRFTDPDGNSFIDSKGQRVKIRVDKSGKFKLKFKKGTSDDVKKEFSENTMEALNAMASTKDGRKAIRRMNRMVTQIQIAPDNQKLNDFSDFYPQTVDEATLTPQGVYIKVLIVPHRGSIEEKAQKTNSDKNEILGATMMVEFGHLKPRQITRDQKDPPLSFEGRYTKLYNSFVKFRVDYRKMMGQQINEEIFKTERGNFKLDRRNQRERDNLNSHSN